MPKRKGTYEGGKAALLEAVRGNKPKDLAGVNLEKHAQASANIHLMYNAALGLSVPARRQDVVDWLRWYVDQPLHENEATTPSESYRMAISYSTLALSVVARLAGDSELCRRVVARCKADISNLILAVGMSAPREVKDEGKPGKPVVLHGNGKLVPAKKRKSSDPDLPYVAEVGKRGHVRERRAGGGFTGPFHYKYEYSLSVMVAQAASLPYRGSFYKWEHEVYEKLVNRWEAPPYWGMNHETVLSFLRHPMDTIQARFFHNLAAEFPSNEGRSRVRKVDGTIECIANTLGDSSTGGLAINTCDPNGFTYRTSCDNGSRGQQDISPQHSYITSTALVCEYNNRPGRMEVPRQGGMDVAWSSYIGPDMDRFTVGNL